ncbi:MAG: hypothetical protein M1835_003325 [Candelina submexicana]|nr:MAG: hypothetical protein M1835_003325 [Candelina submexicana]
MAGLQNYVRSRHSHSLTPQPQDAGMIGAPAQRMSRAEMVQRAKVKTPATILGSARRERSLTNQRSDDYGIDPNAHGPQEQGREIKREYRDEEPYGGPGSGFDTDPGALEETTTEVQVEDSQRETGPARQRPQNLGHEQRNELMPEDQEKYEADFEGPQAREGDEEQEGESHDDDNDESDEESGSSSTADREAEVADDESEQWPRGAQQALQTHAENEMAQRLAPSRGRFAPVPHMKTEVNPLTQLHASEYPALAAREQLTLHDGMGSSHKSYPSTTSGDTDDEAEPLEPDKALLNPYQGPQNVQICKRDSQHDQKKYQQSKISTRAKQQRQNQEPSRSQSTKEALQEYHVPPYPPSQGTEHRQPSYVNQQPRDEIRRTPFLPDKVPGSSARHPGSTSVNGGHDENNRGRRFSDRQRDSHPLNNPLVSPQPPGPENPPGMELDYDPEQLSTMDYSTLQAQPFDFDPKAGPDALSANERSLPLPDQFKHILSPEHGKKQSPLHNPAVQRQFISSLSMEQWEAFGDLITGGFSDILHRLKIVRQDKRKIAVDFEDEIKQREKRVRVKTGGVEELLNDMKRGGQGVLKGKIG